MIKFFGKTYESFQEWFFYKYHPRSKIEGHMLLMDFLWWITLVILFLVFYKNAIIFNQIVLAFLKLGALIQLGLLYFIIRKSIPIIINLKEGYVGLNNGTKAMIVLILLLLASILYYNQESFTNWALNFWENLDLASFNPFEIN